MTTTPCRGRRGGRAAAGRRGRARREGSAPMSRRAAEALPRLGQRAAEDALGAASVEEREHELPAEDLDVALRERDGDREHARRLALDAPATDELDADARGLEETGLHGRR